MNRIIIDGYLGRDAEVKATKTGTSVTTFSVGSTYRKNKDDKDGITTWFNCVAFGKTADGAAKLKKGDHVHVDARMQEEEYAAKDGTKKKIWKAIANSVAVDVVARGASGGTTSTVKQEIIVTDGPSDFEDNSIPF